ncbi:MAG: trehalose-phosphatase [Halothermotrichaceae bacterium]
MSKKYLLKDKNKNTIINQIKAKKYLLLFLDYDGTLSPFKDNPAEAVPYPGIKKCLQSMSEHSSIIISIISGREINQLQQMLKISNVNYAGNHGLDIKTFDGEKFNWSKNEIQYDFLKKIKSKINITFCKNKNYYLEDKGAGFAIHLTENSSQKNVILEYLKNKITDRSFEVMEGRQIIEVRPAGWDKGKAVTTLIDKMTSKFNIYNYQTIYIGDDTTDEDAFKALGDGITIYVKNEGTLNTEAKYYLNNPREVYQLLQIIKDLY